MLINLPVEMFGKLELQLTINLTINPAKLPTSRVLLCDLSSSPPLNSISLSVSSSKKKILLMLPFPTNFNFFFLSPLTNFFYFPLTKSSPFVACHVATNLKKKNSPLLACHVTSNFEFFSFLNFEF